MPRVGIKAKTHMNACQNYFDASQSVTEPQNNPFF
jgi:hypothetical protein